MKDSLRFIRTHLSVIEEAPLQVYSSAIVFSPKNSIVRRLFAHRGPSWLLAWPAVDDEWGPTPLVIGHSAVVKSAIFSPDSKTIASVYDDNTIRILSTKTGKCVHVLAGQPGQIQSVAFSQDSRVLASSSIGGTLRIWDLQTGDCAEVLKYASPTGRAFAFSRDSKLLLTASRNQFVRIWNTQTWDQFILKGHTGAVNSAVISHNSKIVATSSDDATIRLWNTHTGTCEEILTGHTGKVNTAAISPDNRLLVSASSDQTLRVWDLDARKCKKLLRAYDCNILLAVFSPDSRIIASGDTEGHILIWDAQNGAFMHELQRGFSSGIYESLIFSDDRTRLIAVLSTGTVLIHDIQSGNCEQAFEFSPSSKNWTVEVSHDFSMILTASSEDNTVRIWDPLSQRKGLKRARSPDNLILEVETSPNGRTVVLHTTSGHEVWSLRRNQFECLLAGDSDFIQFSPDFSVVVVANETSITMCNMGSGDYTCSFDIKSMVKYCLYSEDCKVLVTSHEDLTMCCWHLKHHNYTHVANAGYIQTNEGFFNQPRCGNVILDGIVIQVVEHTLRRLREWCTWPTLRRDRTWITIGNEKFFKFSPECLNAEISIRGRTAVVDCISGKRVILSFDVGKAGLPPSHKKW